MWAVTGSNDNTAQRWQARSELDIGEDDGTVVFRGHTSAVCAVSYDATSKQLISGAWDKTAIVWDWASVYVLGNHNETVYGVHLSGQRAVTGADVVRIWQSQTCVHVVQTSASLVFCMVNASFRRRRRNRGSHSIGGWGDAVTH